MLITFLRFLKKTNKVYGFPCFIKGLCGFKRDSKEKSLSDLDDQYGLEYDYEDIGIAYDEIHRHDQLSTRKRSILVEKKITEDFAIEYCRKNGLYSPHYYSFKRDGCPLCPQASVQERKEWFKQYPEAFNEVLMLQAICLTQKPNHYPLRGYKMFIEKDYQLCFFDDYSGWIIN